jgi:subfamily B ATP-binding cassette protein HlyB/CyaB
MLDRYAERQLAGNDCGLAICKAALGICGTEVPRHKLRESLAFDEEGSSFEDIKRTLAIYQVECEYRVIEPGNLSLEALGRLLPCVVMVDAGVHNHYLLLHSVGPRGVNVLDPKKGYFEERDLRYLRENLSRVTSATNEDTTLAYARGYVTRKCESLGIPYHDRKPKAQLVMDYNKVLYFESLEERLGIDGGKVNAAYLSELFASEDDSVVPSRYKTFRLDIGDNVIAKAPIGLAFKPGAAALEPRGKEESRAATQPDSIYRFLSEMVRVPEQRSNLKRLLYVGILASLTGMVIVYTNQILIDEVIPTNQITTLYAFVSVLFLVRGFELFLNLMKSYVQVTLGRDMDGWLCGNLHQKIVHSTFESISSYSRGELSLRLNDLLRIKSVISAFLNGYLFAFITLVLALLMSAYISVKICLVILAVSACYSYILKKTVAYVKSLESMRFTEKSHVVNSLLNLVEGHSVIAKNGCEAALLDDQKIRVNKFLGVQFKSMIASQLLVYIPRFISIVGGLTVILISSKAHIVDQELSLGQIFTLIALSEMCFLSLRTILQTKLALQEQAVVVDRYFDLIQLEQRPPREPEESRVHSVRASSLSYQYPASPFRIKVDDLTLRAGDRIVISGANGSGKSTFLKIISGLMQKNVLGSIEFTAPDGTPVSREHGFNRVALVRAEDKIFSETIAFNVTLGNGRGGHRIYEYAKRVGADDFISPNRHPINSVIHDQGANLSTGQRRKLLLLRVLFSRADIIIFDEIFRGIDAGSKARIIETINTFSADKIIIHTSHEDLGNLHINRRLNIADGVVSDSSNVLDPERCEAYV